VTAPESKVTLPRADSLSPAEEQQSLLAEGKEFRPDIEGLRAIAVLAVVLFHAEIPGFTGGFVGVDVFFVISGFLITGLLWREASSSGTVRLARFYGARARRLLPASALVGVFIMVSSVLLLPPLTARTAIGDGIASALYVSNYRFALQGVDYLASFSPPSPFQHYWSLGVEEQFYLVWAPLILGTAWLIRRRNRTSGAATPTTRRPYVVVLGAVAAVSFALSVAITFWAPSLAFFSLPTRAWQLAIGGLVALTALHWRRLSRRAAAITGSGGLALIVLACVGFSQTTLYPGWAALAPTVGSALVIGAGCAAPANGCGRLLKVRPLQWLGRISYSLYLWHWPLLLTALWAIAPVIGYALPLGIGAIGLSVVLAALTLRFVENPLRFAPKIRNSPCVSGSHCRCPIRLARALPPRRWPLPRHRCRPVWTSPPTTRRCSVQLRRFKQLSQRQSTSKLSRRISHPRSLAQPKRAIRGRPQPAVFAPTSTSDNPSARRATPHRRPPWP
jgi:peptidoglycan/LPS O-acetylase OafA/YrhL